MKASYQACIVPHTGTLLDGLRALERGAIGIALVVDEGRLVGTLTDGDVRRAILGGAALDRPLLPFAHRGFTAASPQESRGEVLDLMQARSIEQVPVVDERGTLLGVHLLRELLGAEVRPSWAVVMAGGRGVRLRPITDTLPKPMIKVAGRPILERIVLHLVGHGIRRVFLSVNYLAPIIERHFGDGSRFGCRIDYLREDKPLGTAGALSLLPETPSAPLLVLNGDLLTQVNVADMLAFHQRGGHVATMAVTEYTHTVPFGVVELHDEQIRELVEKPTHAWWANAGIYSLSPEVVGRVRRDEETPMTTLVGDCIARGESVGAYRVRGDWLDIGRPDELKKARGET